MVIEKLRYTKTGKRIPVYEFENHILPKHPEMSLELIEKVLEDPDFVTKQSKSKKEHFYQKRIGKLYYFVVISQHKNVKNLRFILTAFAINNLEFLKEKNIHYRYTK